VSKLAIGVLSSGEGRGADGAIGAAAGLTGADGVLRMIGESVFLCAVPEPNDDMSRDPSAGVRVSKVEVAAVAVASSGSKKTVGGGP
jgi:hypothetical protein